MTSSLVSPKDAVQRLQDGNKRFISGLRSVESIASVRRLAELARIGQTPFAAALACADSRVPTETIFDCGLGDLFVTRLAGNVVTPHILASLEYAALYCGTSLIFVLGHTGCGAVKAAVQSSDKEKAELSHSLQVLVSDVTPAVNSAKRIDGESPESLLRTVERENVRLACGNLVNRSEVLAKLAKEGRIEIVGGLFNMENGAVEFGLEGKLV